MDSERNALVNVMSHEVNPAPPGRHSRVVSSPSAIQAPFGWIGFHVHGGKVRWTTIGHRSREQAALGADGSARGAVRLSAEDQELATLLANRLLGYASGRPVTFDDLPLDWERLTPFQACVYRVCQTVPFGQTVTYGELARMVGNPRAARAVGAALGRNPFPILVPCHRVVGRGGRLTGFTAPGGTALKAALLKFEGCDLQVV